MAGTISPQPTVGGNVSPGPTASEPTTGGTSINPEPSTSSPTGNTTEPTSSGGTSTNPVDDTSTTGSGGGEGSGETGDEDAGATFDPTSNDETTLTDDTTSTDDTPPDETTSDEPDGPNPSPGCGKSARPTDGKVYVAGESWLLFPESYDGNTPLPVLWGFHGCGMGNRGDATRTEYTDATRNTPFQSEYVVAIPISSDAGGCWNYNTDIARVKRLYDELTNNHCVDMDRMFATGHSSGAYFAVALLEAGHAADAAYLNFRGMAPVAASPVVNHSTPMPVLYMENPADTERSDNNASTVVQGFRNANMCSDTTQPYAGADGCTSSSGGAQVNPNCVIYDGCSQPTVWCSHDDQSYGTTGHGIPCFASQAMHDFFSSL